jgi:quercetin dioxygenase-like cupin family protein
MSHQANRIEQEKRTAESIFLVNAAKIPVQKLDKKGAERVEVQYLVDDRQGSDHFALRLYTVHKGGHTPLDQHPYEHHVYVLKGEGLLRKSKEESGALKTIKPGDAIFIPLNAIHQFSNTEDIPLVFLCVKGNPQLYTHELSGGDSDGEEQNYC